MTNSNVFRTGTIAMLANGLALSGLALSGTAYAQEQQVIDNDLANCAAGAGPAVEVTVSGIKAAKGTMRLQSYNGVKTEWLKKGRWLTRIEAPAQSGSMIFCVPVPTSGTYGIAVRHDINDSGKTEITKDGGAMSNNPRINIFNLGKPSYKKTAFEAGPGVTSISITMKYL